MAKSPTSKKAADAFRSLEQDHRDVEDLFARIDSAKAGHARLAIFLQLKDALGKHAVLEEHIVYPALRSSGATATQQAATEGYDEHEGIKGTLAEIEATDPKSEVFLAKCRLLQGLVAHHVKEEEQEMFPAGRKSLSARRLDDLATRVAATRAEQASVLPEEDAARAPRRTAPRPR